MEANDLRCFSVVEMASDRVSDLIAKGLQVVGLGEDGFAKGSGGIAAFGIIRDHENQFVHGKHLTAFVSLECRCLL